MYIENIAKVIADRTGCDPSIVTPESTFSDLGIDSLDTVEMLMALEDELDMVIEPDATITTVGALDEFMQTLRK